MNSERKIEAEKCILRAMSGLGSDELEFYKSMNFTGLSQCCRSFSVEELVQVLKTMNGVILDHEGYQVRVPIKYFPEKF